ncbi:MAG TPA: hypothetical protein VHB68_00485 [Steroidobacteraceae bacterium]|nr:hypothetical protein [Steroidobacteraceae bacterium]
MSLDDSFERGKSFQRHRQVATERINSFKETVMIVELGNVMTETKKLASFPDTEIPLI